MFSPQILEILKILVICKCAISLIQEILWWRGSQEAEFVEFVQKANVFSFINGQITPTFAVYVLKSHSG